MFSAPLSWPSDLFPFSLPLLTHLSSSSLHKQKSAIPPPLQIPPSRARRQFAMRLAQRKAELDATRELEDDVDESQGQQEREVREGHERFKRLFEGMDSSDEEGGETESESDVDSPPKMHPEKRGTKDDEEGVVVV